MPLLPALRAAAQARINAQMAKTHQAVLTEALAHPDVQAEMEKADDAGVPFDSVFTAIVQAILAGFSGGTFNLTSLIPIIVAAIAALFGTPTPANATVTGKIAA